MPLELIHRARSDLFPETGFTNAYGLTETSSTVALLGPEEHRAAHTSDDPKVRARLSSVGQPLPTVELEIRDEEGRCCPVGVPGEIYLRGDQVSGEYREKKALDADGCFRRATPAMSMKTGYLFLSGRADDVIVRGGENMSPGEIEDVLLTHAAIADAAAVAVPSVEWGEAVGVAVSSGKAMTGRMNPNSKNLSAHACDRHVCRNSCCSSMSCLITRWASCSAAKSKRFLHPGRGGGGHPAVAMGGRSGPFPCNADGIPRNRPAFGGGPDRRAGSTERFQNPWTYLGQAAVAGFSKQAMAMSRSTCRAPTTGRRCRLCLAIQRSTAVVKILAVVPKGSVGCPRRAGRVLGMAIASLDEIGASPASQRLCHGLPAQVDARYRRPLVVDLSSLWAGPLAARLLRLAGAEVVKVESRNRPDAMRDGDPHLFGKLNVGKTRLSLDLRLPDERDVLIALIRRADVVIEAARPRALRQLGIDAEALVREVPGLVWATITGHGVEGAAADCVGFGDDCGVAGGLSAALRDATSKIGFVGDAIADPLTGIFTALTIAEQTGHWPWRAPVMSMAGVVATALAAEACP